MDLMLDGKVVLISGASRGIGASIAKNLLSEGCNVIIGGRDSEKLSNTCKDLESDVQEGRKIISFQGDLTEKGIPEKFISFALENFKSLDILINNVGGSISGGIEETTDKNWEDAFHLNLYQAVKCSRLAVSEMRRGNGGSILNVASIY
ncbi:MAG: SDR family NAD(P)-dependent oxidoreductase, partial [Nitrospinota bacterium]|nr:SDR family NAD(P)-dependent oxidoreductase [Nitrospinota bacterium]